MIESKQAKFKINFSIFIYFKVFLPFVGLIMIKGGLFFDGGFREKRKEYSSPFTSMGEARRNRMVLS